MDIIFFMKTTIDILIIGAGASGLFLASLLTTKSFILLDHNEKIGRKIRVSGGGRCNVTNASVEPKNYVGDFSSRFVQHVLRRFNQEDLLAWLASAGLVPVVRKGSQYFCPNSANELLAVFKQKIPFHHIHLKSKVKAVRPLTEGFEVETTQGVYLAKKLVVATGGLSFPSLGASSIGYDIAKFFGHRIVSTKPALVGLTLQPNQFFFKRLAGISTEVKIHVGEKEIKGDLLFAHKGISGPAVLNASLYWERGNIVIDFLPNVNLDQLHRSKKKISNLLALPSRLAKALLDHLEVEDQPAVQLSSSAWEKLATLHTYTFAPAGSFGYSKAEVTKGGIATEEIDAGSMMSKKQKGLYFLGEVVDVTGELGGYNFQWAFSSAFVCAKEIE